MKAISSIVRELLGLFIEDWAFALQLAAFLTAVIFMNEFSVGSANARALMLVGVPAVILLIHAARARKH